MEMEKVSKIHVNIKYAILILVSFVILTGTSLFFLYMGEGWYNSINKPFFAPSTTTGIVIWLVTYITIAFAAYKTLNSNYGSRREKALRLLLITITMLAIWSFLFYFKNDTWASFVDLLLLMVSSFFLIKEEYLIDSKAAWLLVAYYVWLGLISVLNYNIVMLN